MYSIFSESESGEQILGRDFQRRTVSGNDGNAAPNIYHFSFCLQWPAVIAECTSLRVSTGCRSAANQQFALAVSAEALPDLFSAERTDAVETKAKQQALFLSHTDVESRILCRHRAAVPTVANRRRGTNE